jgi:glucan phosphoethanolaminetransferase (alkaline phosphatase superfamily)
MTRTSFAGLINRLKYPGIGKQFLTQSNCLFRLAKESELNTVFIYSQHRNIADTLLPFMCSNYIDKVLVDSDAPENRRDFDDSIFYNLEQTDMRKSNFIVIGPDGAHTPYVEKSPERFKGFDEEYDNAILYTDSVIASIIENLRGRSKKPTYVIVTSDHGELLKGEDEQRGHGWFKREVVQVPFLFFSFNDPDPESTMAEVRKVRSHFDIATLAIRLMGYNVMVEGEQEREIYINGSDLSGLAGYMRLQFLGGQLRSADLFGGVGETPSIDEFR